MAAANSGKANSKPKSRKRRRYDWPKAERLYVEGIDDPDEGRVFLSLRLLAKHLDYPQQRVFEHSSKKDWPQKRALFQHELDRERQRTTIERLATDAAQLDETALAASRTALDVIQRRVEQIAATQTNDPDHDDSDSGAAAARLTLDIELSRLGLALRRFHAAGLAAVGQRISPPAFDEADPEIESLVLDAAHGRLVARFADFRTSEEAERLRERAPLAIEAGSEEVSAGSSS